MNTGDKAILLQGNEEGVIRRITNDRLVEIEIEDTIKEKFGYGAIKVYLN